MLVYLLRVYVSCGFTKALVDVRKAFEEGFWSVLDAADYRAASPASAPVISFVRVVAIPITEWKGVSCITSKTQIILQLIIS